MILLAVTGRTFHSGLPELLWLKGHVECLKCSLSRRLLDRAKIGGELPQLSP